MPAEKKSRIEADIESLEKGAFTGEEGGSERSTPRKDFLSSIAVAAIGILAMVLSVQLDTPASVFTSPGLLPFVTGLSLVIMALGLIKRTIRVHGWDAMRQSSGINHFTEFVANEEARRTALLMVIVGAYVILVGIISFDLRFKTDFHTFRFSSYEAISIPVIAYILWLFWRARVIFCVLVAAVIVVALATIFRDGFLILLPGTG